jgi:hypothetical protein
MCGHAQIDFSPNGVDFFHSGIFTYYTDELENWNMTPSSGPLSGGTVVTLSLPDCKSRSAISECAKHGGKIVVRLGGGAQQAQIICAKMLQDGAIQCTLPESTLQQPHEIRVDVSYNGGRQFTRMARPFRRYFAARVASILPSLAFVPSPKNSELDEEEVTVTLRGENLVQPGIDSWLRLKMLQERQKNNEDGQHIDILRTEKSFDNKLLHLLSR